MLNKWCGRFCLMYKTLKYNPPTLRKFKRKGGQVTDKFGKKTHLYRGRMQNGHRIKDLLSLLIIFGLFCFHIDTKCHERATLIAVKKWKNKAVLWLSYHFFTCNFVLFNLVIHPSYFSISAWILTRECYTSSKTYHITCSACGIWAWSEDPCQRKEGCQNSHELLDTL